VKFSSGPEPLDRQPFALYRLLLPNFLTSIIKSAQTIPIEFHQGWLIESRIVVNDSTRACVMTLSSLHPDDLPSNERSDGILLQQLESAITKRFYEACDGVTQALLMNCEWSVTTRAPALTLIIISPNLPTHGRVLNHLMMISTHLAPFTNRAKIRVCPPPGSEIPIEIWVGEVPVPGD
jgi:hypothetical protein